MSGDSIVETVEYDVEIIVRLRTTIEFAPIERDSEVTAFDAIAAAWGVIPSEVGNDLQTGFGGEFSVTLEHSTHETLRQREAGDDE